MHTPDTNEVRTNYADLHEHLIAGRFVEATEEFDRWLDAHDAELKAYAFDEGVNAASDGAEWHPGEAIEWRAVPNPYRVKD